MKNLDCNQIMIFINLELIGEEKKYIYSKKNLKKNYAIWWNHLMQCGF